MRSLFSRVRDALSRRTLDRELDTEIATHLELAAADHRQRGLTPDAAARAARRSFGGVALAKEAEREVRGFPWLESVARDVGYAFRGFRRTPAATAIVVTTLAVGIGASVTVFSAIDALWLKSAPVAQADRLVSVYTRYPAASTTNPNLGDQNGSSSFPDYLDFRDSGVLHSLAAYASTSVTIDAAGVTDIVSTQIVTGNFFEVLGVRTAAGRPLDARDDRQEAPEHVAVISYRAWRGRFGGDASIINRLILLNGRSFTIVGVGPRGFDGPSLGESAEIWVPMALQEEVRPPSSGALRRRLGGLRTLGARDVRWLTLVGRLKDGESPDVAAAGFAVIGRTLAAAHPDTNPNLSATATPFGRGGGVRTRALPVVRLLSLAVGVVLLIACANVANLLLARALTRRREVAVRMAIGASRGRLIRQWLTEAMLLGLVGGIASVVVAQWAMPTLYGLGILTGVEVAINTRVLAFAMACGLATGLLFGLAPIIPLLHGEQMPALRDEAGAVTTGHRSARLRAAFVVLQVALSVVLLVGAGLLVRTFQHAISVDLGYDVDRVLLADVRPGESYAPAASQHLYEQLLERVKGMPGVRAAAAARVTVLSGSTRTVPISPDGQPLLADFSNALPVRANVVSDGYLETMGIPLLRGRGFEPSDNAAAPHVTIVSQSLARRLWKDADPIGQTLVSVPAAINGANPTVIGVVPDSVYRSATEGDPPPFFYLPLAQNYEAGVTLHVRTAGDPLTLVPALRDALRQIDPRVPLVQVRQLTDEFERSTAPQRTMALLAGSLGAVALLLAAVGLYGVISYGARQRTAEMGVRLALGASRLSLIRLVLRSGTRLVAVGGLLGLAIASASVRIVQAQLFGVEATDPLTWLSMLAMLLIVALTACVIPAVRATRTSPLRALRST